MYHVHQLPYRIFTSYIHLCAIFISHTSSYVRLFGVYGSLYDADTSTIEIETDFDTLNRLLPLADEGLEEAVEGIIAALAEAITHPTEANQTIYVEEWGGLYFSNLLFALQLIYEYDDEGGIVATNETGYLLHGYAPRKPLSNFGNLTPPHEKASLIHYYNQLLMVQYHLFLDFMKRMERDRALTISGLSDPLIYGLAKNLYELQEEMGWETM